MQINHTTSKKARATTNEGAKISAIGEVYHTCHFYFKVYLSIQDMLAGRTTDERIDIAHERLMKNKLSVETILSMEESTLANLLEGVTSGAQKAK